MEKTMEQNTYVLQDDDSFGTVKIADDVVAAIGSIAATEVEGVVSMAGNIGNELASKMGVKSLTKGVKVEVNGKNVKADITLIVKYGYSIPEVSEKVQKKVSQAIENMTGLEVEKVNVRIAGIAAEEQA